MNSDEIVTKKDLYELEQRLLAKLSASQERMKTRRFVRTKDLQKLFGFSASTVQNLRNQGKLSFKKIGGTIIYDLDEIESTLI